MEYYNMLGRGFRIAENQRGAYNQADDFHEQMAENAIRSQYTRRGIIGALATAGSAGARALYHKYYYPQDRALVRSYGYNIPRRSRWNRRRAVLYSRRRKRFRR